MNGRNARSILFAMPLLLGALLMAACRPVTPSSPTPVPRLTYHVGSCTKGAALAQPQAWEHVDIRVEGHTVHIHHRLPYVCCAKIALRLDREDHVLKVVERNVGEVCKCMCGYEVEAEITDLPSGTYTVQVWGVEHPHTGPSRLRGEARVVIP